MKLNRIALLVVWALVLGMLSVPHAIAEDGPAPMGHLDSRDSTLLHGRWRVIADPFDNGSLDYWSRKHRDGFWRDRTPQTPSDLVEYSFSDARTLKVPGDWNSQDPRLFFYEGAVWYRHALDWTPREGERAFLHFGGANRVTTVWVNGEEFGSHGIGFTPFEFEVTDALRPGENVLVVRVDNRRDAGAVPGLMYDWWNYGGLTRPVRLVRVPTTFVRRVDTVLVDGVVRVDVELDGPGAKGAAFKVELGGLSVRGTTDTRGMGSLEIRAEGLARWSPKSPTLHRLVVTSGDSEIEDRVGLRKVEAVGGEIRLNGERVFLRGICIHEEALSREGRAWSEHDARELLGLAKELGCNYVRLAHYPHNEAMLRVADEMGLLVWAEIPVYWKLDYTADATLEEAKAHLRGMIVRDRSRASVIVWSVGNETGDDGARTKFRVALGRYAKALDPTRLVSAALFARGVRGADGTLEKLVVDDPFGEIADVLAINQYVGWYHDTPDDLTRVKLELGWDKPFVISEFGAGIRQGLHGAREQRWTEEYGVWLYERTLAWSEGLPNISGLSPWVLKDFRSPRRPLYGVQDWYNRKGMVSETGARKAVFGVLQRHYESIRERGDR